MKKYMAMMLTLLLLLALVGCSGSEAVSRTSTEAPEPSVSIMDHANVIFAAESVQLPVAADSQVVWSSSDPSVASVDDQGVVTGVGAGTATITAAIAEKTEISASTEITVVLHVSSVSFTQKEMILLLGSEKENAEPEYIVLPENAFCHDVTISSSDSNVVTVDADGTIHAAAPGTAVLTIQSGDDVCTQTDSCEVTVKQGVTSITLSQETADFYWGDSLKLSADVLPQDAEDLSVVWSSSDESIATVSQDGAVTAVGDGAVDIICMAQDGSETAGVCHVNVVVGIKKLSVSGESALLLIGGTEEQNRLQLETVIEPENATYKSVVWTSSDPSIVTVDENGVVTGIAPGKATITAATTDPRFADKVSGSYKVEVGSIIQNIALNGVAEKMAKGSGQKANVVLTPEKVYNSNLKWSSTNENIVKVDQNGGIRAVGVGTAQILCEATDGSGKTASQEITVFQSVTGLRAGQYETVLFEGDDTTLKAIVTPEDATDKTLDWSSSNTSVATVSSNGVVSARSAGKATITAIAKDGSNVKCTFNVVVEPALPLTLESLGFGIYNANLLGITVKNHCAKHTIKNFDFDIELYSYDGSKLNTSGSYSIGSNAFVGPGAKSTIRRTHSGVAWAQKIKITITGVVFSDDSYYSIPWSRQETWTFTR